MVLNACRALMFYGVHQYANYLTAHALINIFMTYFQLMPHVNSAFHNALLAQIILFATPV
jgi:hypothetical protein